MKLMHIMKWLYPGMRVKRWLVVAISGGSYSGELVAFRVPGA